jgi:hypothetical protein
MSMNRGISCFRLLTLLNPVVNTFGVGFMVMVLNATFNNISAISWWSVLLVEETGVPGENH